MPRAPSQIFIYCESCQRRASVRQIRRWLGQCHRCQGESWTLVVLYTDTDVEASAMSMLSSLVTGFGWYSRRTVTNQIVVDGVSAEVLQFLSQQRFKFKQRVAEFVRLRDQQSFRERGGQSCQVCDALYVPAASKPWTQQGYCSKLCEAKGGANAAPVFEASTEQQGRGPTITVVCPNGHQFEVLASFTGCMRPCIDCGAKTPVP